MALLPPSLSNPSRKKRKQIIAIDLGSRATKAVLMEPRGETFTLLRFALLEAPLFEKSISTDLLADHLHNVAQALGTSTKFVAASIGLGESIVRQIEMPQIPVDQMRSILKMSHKSYLQQDLPNHVFDCFIMPPRADATPTKSTSGPIGGQAKLKVLSAAAKKQLIDNFLQATNQAGLVADALVPSLVAPINCFEKALPDIHAKETVALVDIGFKHTSVSVLDRGELATNRVIHIGGEQLTIGLAESKAISYAEAEGIKVAMAAEVEAELSMQLLPLGREIRASLDFFEHQNDRPVTQVYLSGGTSQSEMIVQLLQSEIMAECKTWTPTGFLHLDMPDGQSAEIEQVGPQLTVAIGTALAAY